MAQFAKTVIALVLLAGVTASAQTIRNVPRITIDELKVLMEQKAAVVLDVREPGAFAKGRIPGAKALKGGWDEWVSRGEAVEK